MCRNEVAEAGFTLQGQTELDSVHMSSVFTHHNLTHCQTIPDKKNRLRVANKTAAKPVQCDGTGTEIKRNFS